MSIPRIAVFAGEPKWNSKPAWKLPGWAESITVVSILLGAMYFTRRRNYRVFGVSSLLGGGYLDQQRSRSSSDHLLAYNSGAENDDEFVSTNKDPPKLRRWCCCVLAMSNTSRFRNNIHSRVLERFPFLIEMFYWIVNYAFYRRTSITSQRLFAESGIWNLAQAHGIEVLEAEQYSFLSSLFPVRRRDVQQWFTHGHQQALSVLNRAYALIHIPGTVGFICWYYYAAPSFDTFATARRTMTLTNFCAFLTFALYPCMPPRLLPKDYGFLDTVRHDDAQSVWTSGKYVNQLAAMPSMHFGYAFCIGMTLVYHYGLFRRSLEKGESRKNKFWKLFYLFISVGYTAFILTTIVATANHHYMDAMVTTFFVCFSLLRNKVFYVFVPLEDLLLYCIRAAKPIPTTGDWFHAV